MKDSGTASGVKIPEHWNVAKFWTIAAQVSNSGHADVGLMSVYLDRGVIPYSEGGGLVHKPSESLDEYQLVNPGNFVINNQQAWRGSVGVSKHRGLVSPAYLVFQLSKDLDPVFANYQFRERRFVDEMMLSSQGVGDIQRQVKWPLLRQARVFVPPAEEQRNIGKYLDGSVNRIDALVSKKSRFIELLREKRQALITHAVTKGLNPKSPMKESGVGWLGKIPAHWDVVQSRRLFAERNQKAQDGDQQLTVSQKYGLLPQSEFMEREGRRVVVVQKGHEILKRTLRGDFVISMRSFQGGLELSTQDGAISSAYVPITPTKWVVSAYFRWAFKSITYIQALQTTSDLVRDGQALRFENFAKVPLPHVPEDEQLAIASFLDHATSRIDALIGMTERSIELLLEHRSALITAAVTGKIDLRPTA